MTFGSPWMLALLVAIPAMVGAYASSRRRGFRRAAALSEQGLVATSARPRTRVRRHLPFALFTVALTVLIVGTARPMASVKTLRREGTVILAVDVSNSMKATDVRPTRIEAAKAAARAFVDRQPPAVRIGVVAFGDGAVIVQTPTTAHADAVRSIDRLSVGGGTSLGQGLVTSLSAIAGKPVTIDPEALASDSAQVDIGFFGSATVVLLSDGEETSPPDPVSVAQVASVAGVRVDTIGIGTDAGTVVTIDGFSVATARDSDLLKQVASTTDGSYFEAGDATGLAAISKKIDLRFKIVSQHTEVTGLFSAVGIVLLLAGALLSVLWFGRVV
ncbi:MAG: VWA domain-containing protein [Actinomycetota bacterium]|nr:VWA domain-containing protein [Actinomycetota bacterium]